MLQIKAYGVSSAAQALGPLQISRRKTLVPTMWPSTLLIAVSAIPISIKSGMNGAILFIPWSRVMKL